MQCTFNSPYKVEKNFIIKCFFGNHGDYQKLNNIYLLPYYQTIYALSPFEIIIRDPIKNIEFIPVPEPDEKKEDDDDDNDTIFIIIIIGMSFIILILIFILVIILRRSKQKDFSSTGPLLNKDEMELKE